jgi:hypothetical protein
MLGALVVVGSSYWLVPALQGTATPLSTFTAEHTEVFKTAGDTSVGVMGNVLALHGFWGEREPWADRFLIPKDLPLFGIAFSVLALLIAYGFYAGLKNRETRSLSIFALLVAAAAVIFSVGVGDGPLRNINLWLFEHVSFWKGFRDTQKWTSILALVYALYAGYGAALLLGTCKQRFRLLTLAILLAIPVIMTPMILFGFAGQLQTVHYPESWAQVDGVLKKQEDCKVLFLPWHQYYTLAFNDDHLVANTASVYFDCEVVSGKNMELGSIDSQGGFGGTYSDIEKAVTDNQAPADQTIQYFKREGFTHIIFTDDLILEDQYIYPFLQSAALNLETHNEGIYLYKIL